MLESCEHGNQVSECMACQYDLLTHAEMRVYELGEQLLSCERQLEEASQRLAAAEARSMATKYEELRSIIDGGSESMTHEDAVRDLKDRDNERDELQRKLAAAEAKHLTDSLVVEQLQREIAAAEAARDIAEQQLTVICDGVNRRCGVDNNQLPLVSLDRLLAAHERDLAECRRLLREAVEWYERGRWVTSGGMQDAYQWKLRAAKAGGEA